MGQFATVDDVEIRYEGVIPEEREDYVDAKITDAESLLTALLPSLLDPSKTGAARAARAKSVVCEAVLRVYRNPSGFRTEGMEQLQGGRSAATESGQLEFTQSELASLRLNPKKRGMGTIKVKAWNPFTNIADATADPDWPLPPCSPTS